MVVAFLERGSLSDLLKTQTLSFEEFKIIVRITQGVGYLHSRHPPVIHGDLHPGNVLFDNDGNPRLCDFNLTHIRHEVSRTRSNRRGSGEVRFLAPELCDSPTNEFNPTCKSDVYALAMICFNMWTGEKPFSEIQLEWQVAWYILKGRRPRRPTSSPVQVDLSYDVEVAFWNLLEDMWDQNANNRPSCAAALARLDEMFEGGFVVDWPAATLPRAVRNCIVM
ncbi:kinase-like protein [Clavulina sp. PMI_390]|nr:kinase-like protein [Clavulina sp. PMI_390]